MFPREFFTANYFTPNYWAIGGVFVPPPPELATRWPLRRHRRGVATGVTGEPQP